MRDDGRPRARRRGRHHPEIEPHQVARCGGQQVARVGVGVKVAVGEELAEGALDAHFDEVDDRQAQARHRGVIRELDAVDPLEGENTAPGCAPDDARHPHPGGAGVQRRKRFRSAPLLHVVELPEERGREFVHQGRHRLRDDDVGQGGQGGDAGVEGGCQGAEERHVDRERGRDAGALHLDRHLFPRRPQRRFVHLAQGRGRDGLGGEGGVDRVDRRPELRLDDCAREGGGEGRGPVLQGGEGGQVGGRQEVGAGREDLADLGRGEEGRVEIGDPHPEKTSP